MKKIILSILALALFAIPFGASAASVTVDDKSVVCGRVTFAGNAVYNSATELLRISHGGGQIATFTTGAATWSIETAVAGSEVTAEIITIATGIAAASASDTFVVNCGSMNPMSVGQVWGLTGYLTPRLAVGVSAVDEFGFTDTCYWWMSKGADGKGCMDIRATDYYRLPIIKHILGR